MTDLIKAKEAAQRLNVSVATLKLWRKQPGRGPRFVKLGAKSIRYAPEALDEFIRSHEEDITRLIGSRQQKGGR